METLLKRIAVVVLGIVAVGLPSAGFAECCRLLKSDEQTQSTTVRVCEVAPERHCDPPVIFSGVLQLGEDHEICAVGRTVVYQEFDATLGRFGPPVEALCLDGLDVEL